jgi:conjugative relaxase-like TrwC/TraI family protein
VVVAVMELKKLTAGDGYTYLVRHVAAGDVDLQPGQDLAGYYAAGGNPPGVWIGRGAPDLGVAGQRVTAAQMRNLFGLGLHPDADRIMDEYLERRARPGMSDAQIARLGRDAETAARLGRRFALYRDVAPYEERVTARLAEIREATGRDATPAEARRVRAEEAARADAAVAGFDLVFAPPKSMALLWALHPDPAVRDAVERAHREAMAEALAMIEEHAAFTRTGARGVAQIATRGLVAVSFTHYDTRDGDPNLHEHVVVSNKICGVDGVWRALDARGLHAMKVAASDRYNTALTARVRAWTGADVTAKHTPGGKEPVWEITGIPAALIEHFSARSADIRPLAEQLMADYRREHGRDPDTAARKALSQQANLMTRQAKKQPRTLARMRADWHAQAVKAFGHDVITTIGDAAPGTAGRQLELDLTAARPTVELVAGTAPYTALVDELAARVVASVQEGRSTWTVWNLHAAAQRLLRDPGTFTGRGVSEPDVAGITVLADAVTAAASGPGHSINLTPAPLVAEPDVLRRPDGASVFTVHAATRYTSPAVLAAESRLLDAAVTVPDGPHLAPDTAQITDAVEQFTAATGRRLDDGQHALVEAFAADPRVLVAGIGPAGTGKTTAMRALHHVLAQTGTGRLIPLATSARSAAVLAEELGIPAENLHRFLALHGRLPSRAAGHETASRTRPHAGTAHQDDPQRGVPESARIRPGDVILIDEAGMAGTFNLDRILTLAHEHGARVRLLGDDRQLSAVESGGALRLITTEAGAVRLETVHRFTDPAEADATLKLREGDSTGLDYHQQAGRLHGGLREDMAEAAYTGWLADVRAGKTSLLTTSTNADVTALSARARTDRVTAGQVETGGVRLADGNTAGRGDWIVTRLNDRHLRTAGGRSWVRNGDLWTVTARHRGGSLTVRHQGSGATVKLPASYVKTDVQLAYAATAHRVQGATVDTSHALIGPGTSREEFYVQATRAASGTHLYVITHEDLLDGEDAIDQHRWDSSARTARTVLEGVLRREASEPAATHARAHAQEREASLAVLVPRYQHAQAVLTAGYYHDVIRAVLGDHTAQVLARDTDSYGNLVAALRRAHQAGWQPERALAHATRELPAHHQPSHDDGAGWGESGQPVRVAGRGAVSSNSDGGTPVFRLTRALESLAVGQPAPPALARPTRGDLDRYAALLAGRDIPLHGINLADALWRPAVLEPADVLDRRELLVVPSYRQPLAQVFRRQAAEKIAGEVSWADARATLFRAQLLGHDPAVVLRAVAAATDSRRALKPGQEVAWLLRDYLTAHPGPQLADPTSRAGRTTAWQTIAWTFKAHETAGHDPAELLPDAAEIRAGADGLTGGPARFERMHRLANTYLYVQETARDLRESARHAGALPWTPAPLSGTTASPAHVEYLHHLHDAIATRVQALRDDLAHRAETDVRQVGRSALPAPDRLPAWAATLRRPGPHAPADADPEATRRDVWLDNAAIVAAHREQHDLATGRSQVLGPFPARGADPGYADSYWAAATAAITAARHSANPPANPDKLAIWGGRENLTDDAVTILRGITTTIWRRLTHQQQDAVAATMLAHLGTLAPDATPASPDGTDRQPRPGQDTITRREHEVDDVETAVLHPANVRHLHHALSVHRLLAPAEGVPGTPERRPDDQDPRRRPQPGPNRPPVRGRNPWRDEYATIQERRAAEAARRAETARRRQPQPQPRPQGPQSDPGQRPGYGYGVPQPGRPYPGTEGPTIQPRP